MRISIRISSRERAIGPGNCRRRLYDRPCRTADQVRAGRVLDRRRHVVIMAGWSVTTATYFAFRDDLLKGLIARQAEQQYAYEDRIAELRARIDRTTSRQLLDQEQFEQKLDDLLRRQATLESRAAALDGIVDPTATGSIRPPRGRRNPTGAKPASDRSMPDSHDRRSFLEPDWAPTTARPARTPTSTPSSRASKRRSTASSGGRPPRCGRCRTLRRQGAQACAACSSNSASSSRRPRPATGGPFVPVKLPGEGNGFERALTRVNIARAQAEQLSRSLVSVPVRKPVDRRNRSQLHLRRARRSVSARRRDAHRHRFPRRDRRSDPCDRGRNGDRRRLERRLRQDGRDRSRQRPLDPLRPSIADRRDVGDTVRIGQIVGRMGSTGRSTGPHLHYETRIDGEAVDPQKFLNAGDQAEGANGG